MAPSNLPEILEQTVELGGDKGISVYLPGNTHVVGQHLSYNELRQLATSNVSALNHIPRVQADTVFLLHFDGYLDGFEWLWSVLAAGYLPAISTPFTNDIEQRKKHLMHLRTLLHNPVIVTREYLISEFVGLDETLISGRWRIFIHAKFLMDLYTHPTKICLHLHQGYGPTMLLF